MLTSTIGSISMSTQFLSQRSTTSPSDVFDRLSINTVILMLFEKPISGYHLFSFANEFQADNHIVMALRNVANDLTTLSVEFNKPFRRKSHTQVFAEFVDTNDTWLLNHEEFWPKAEKFVKKQALESMISRSVNQDYTQQYRHIMVEWCFCMTQPGFATRLDVEKFKIIEGTIDRFKGSSNGTQSFI